MTSVALLIPLTNVDSSRLIGDGDADNRRFPHHDSEGVPAYLPALAMSLERVVSSYPMLACTELSGEVC